MIPTCNDDPLARIEEAFRNGDPRLQEVLARWRGHEFVVCVDGQWRLEGFITFFKAVQEVMAAVDGTMPSGLPLQCLDPLQIARFFRIPLDEFVESGILPPHLLDPGQIAHFRSIPFEEFHWWPGRGGGIAGKGAAAHEEFKELPQEVGTARAAEILGVSKDTVLRLKAAGLLEYRNTAPPNSSRPVYAFSLRSVMELRTSYERDDPLPYRPVEPPNRRVKEQRKYKHLDLDD